MGLNETSDIYLPSQISEADIQLVLFTSLFGQAKVTWNEKQANVSLHNY